MSNIVYYVATSLDGYISGPEGDISKFSGEGEAVNAYLQDLKKFHTTIMGRHTYEFGYRFGLQPGEPAYAHMEHHIFSNTLVLKNKSKQVHIEKPTLQRIDEIRDTSQTDVYLCGGGVFAGWLLDNHRIDQLKIKLNPIILGAGVRLFGKSKTQARWELMDKQSFEDGLQFLSYDIKREE